MDEKKLKMLRKRVIGILPMPQVEMYKKIKISSQDASRVVQSLLNDNLILREKILYHSRVTFMLSRKAADRHKQKQQMNYSAMIHNGMIAPCIGCPIESGLCNPTACGELTKWVV